MKQGYNKTPRIVALPNFVQKQSQQTLESAGIIVGEFFDQESVWQLKGVDKFEEENGVSQHNSHHPIIGVYLPEASISEIDKRDTIKQCVSDELIDQLPYQYLVVLSENGDFYAVVREEDEIVTESIEVNSVDLDRLFTRINADNDTPLETLRKKTVAIIGLGSGGGLLATYLAKSGIGNLILIDSDIFELHNIVRHVCGLDSIGRKKVYAVRDYIKRRVPSTDIEVHDRDFHLDTKSDIEYFKQHLSSTDMVIAASAQQTTNFQLNSFIFDQSLDIPVIYAGMFSNLNGGIIIRVDPNTDDPCYHCIYSKSGQGGRDAAENSGQNGDAQGARPAKVPAPREPDATIPYDRTLEDEVSEPGLGIDIDNFTVFVTKVALSNLLRGVDHGLHSLSRNIYTWANRDFILSSFEPSSPDWKLNALELTYTEKEQIPQRPDCEYCGSG